MRSTRYTLHGNKNMKKAKFTKNDKKLRKMIDKLFYEDRVLAHDFLFYQTMLNNPKISTLAQHKI